jgi:hypothetical protein
MKKKLSWKQKNRLLLFAALATLWIVYAFAVSNTLGLRSECNELQLQLDSASGAPGRAQELRSELQRLEEITGGTADSATASVALHEKLLSIISAYCQENNLILRDFATPLRYSQQEWIVETHPVTVEGNFISLVKLVQLLEQEKTGKVISADFRSRRDNKTQALSLTVTIYVQNIIREKS